MATFGGLDHGSPEQQRRMAMLCVAFIEADTAMSTLAFAEHGERNSQ